MPHVDGDDDGVGYGVFGRSLNSHGVRGSAGNAIFDSNISNVGVYGSSSDLGVLGKSDNGTGVRGESNAGVGVQGSSNSNPGVSGDSNSDVGVFGASNSGYGVFGRCDDTFGTGVYGSSNDGTGVTGESIKGFAVEGISTDGIGVHGESESNPGVWGKSTDGTGVIGISGQQNIEYPLDWEPCGVVGGSPAKNGIGVAGWSPGLAGYFHRDVRIVGNLQKAGGSFKIDHPLDPANKYLSHSFVESPEMKNVYDGEAVLDDQGEAKVELPDWFDALNKDFRYQLTAIGAPAPNLYIAEEINNRLFKIAGGSSGVKVCWQVTGIRKDPYANTYRIQVEEDKPDKQQGYYLHPEVYGEPEEKGISQLIFRLERMKPPSLSKVRPSTHARN
jgi:hypothetical protein